MDVLIMFAVSGFAVYFFYRDARNTLRGIDNSILPKVNEQFWQLVVEHENPLLSFDGSCAEIVQDKEEMLDDGGMGTVRAIQRFARNEYGEYFFIISDGENRPFFKHVPHVNAKIALGPKYVAPRVVNE